jgi:hypothetical protein
MRLLLILFIVPPVFAADAPELVKQGILHFAEGRLEAAGKAFAEADVARPDDLRIAFDQACVFAAQHDTDKAVEYFRKASLSREQDLAVAARFNLGSLAAAMAGSVFGEHPEDAEPEVRKEGIDHLNRAVRHYMGVLDLDPTHEEARYNVELIRIWIKYMKALWAEKDKQKQRDEMDLLQFLQMIEQKETAYRAGLQVLFTEDDSPKKRQLLRDLEGEQRALFDEIEPLKQKIEEAVTQGAAQQQAAPDAEAVQQAVDTLKGWADESGGAMLDAADLVASSPEDAPPLQDKALDALDRIFGTVAPYPTVVQKALKTQQGLVDATSVLVERPEEAQDLHYDLMSKLQERVAGWSEVMVYKAREGLAAMEPPEGQQGPPPPPAGDEQAEGLKSSMEQAVALGPQVHDLATEAAAFLVDENGASALPPEEEALRLLKEIAKDLPKQDQDKNKDQNKDQQEKDQQQQDQQDQQQQQQQRQQQQRDLTREEMENLLQKAQEQEQKYRDEKDQRERALIRPQGVEKDW